MKWQRSVLIFLALVVTAKLAVFIVRNIDTPSATDSMVKLFNDADEEADQAIQHRPTFDASTGKPIQKPAAPRTKAIVPHTDFAQSQPLNTQDPESAYIDSTHSRKKLAKRENKQQKEKKEREKRKKRRKRAEELAKKDKEKKEAEEKAERERLARLKAMARPAEELAALPPQSVQALPRVSPSPTPGPDVGILGNKHKAGDKLTPDEIEDWIKKLTENPSPADAKAFFTMYLNGEITRDDFYTILKAMNKSDNVKVRRYAVLGATVEKSPESFEILAERSLVERDPLVQNKANQGALSYQDVSAVGSLTEVLKTGSIFAKIKGTEVLDAFAQSFVSKPKGSAEPLRPLVIVLENLIRETQDSNLKSHATQALASINKVLEPKAVAAI